MESILPIIADAYLVELPRTLKNLTYAGAEYSLKNSIASYQYKTPLKFLFFFTEILLNTISSPARKRGASRSSRVLGAGCNGCIASSDLRLRADGQVVCS